MSPALTNRAYHGSTHRILAAILAVLLLTSVMAIAHDAQATPAENTNTVTYWCGSEDAGVKIEPVSTPFIVPEPSAGAIWSLLVLKAASGPDENETWSYPTVGAGYSHSSGHNNSHAILCWETVPPTTVPPTTVPPTTVPPTTV
ncbi:MAG: hypothetical protein DRP42_05500, partial [Tenericutes bacterium]